MKMFVSAGACALALLSAPVMAQDTSGATSPDGSRPFGFEPYIGVMGGYHLYDRKPEFQSTTGARYDGAVIEGVLGANVPLGPMFVGVEGHGAKGFGNIDWEYGVRGRAGFRAGETGMIYGSVGHMWYEAQSDQNFTARGATGQGFNDRKGWVYGLGVEVGPREIGLGGLTGESGARLRISVETFEGKSIRPMGGLIFHF